MGARESRQEEAKRLKDEKRLAELEWREHEQMREYWNRMMFNPKKYALLEWGHRQQGYLNATDMICVTKLVKDGADITIKHPCYGNVIKMLHEKGNLTPSGFGNFAVALVEGGAHIQDVLVILGYYDVFAFSQLLPLVDLKQSFTLGDHKMTFIDIVYGHLPNPTFKKGCHPSLLPGYSDPECYMSTEAKTPGLLVECIKRGSDLPKVLSDKVNNETPLSESEWAIVDLYNHTRGDVEGELS